MQESNQRRERSSSLWAEMRHDSALRKENEFNKSVKTFLEKETKDYLGEKILDNGCGLYAESYLPEGYDVYRIDLIKQFKEDEHSYVGDAEKLPFGDNEFGVVISKEVYGYLINSDKCLNEMTRVLKPNGLLILMDWEGNLKEFDKQKTRIQNFYPEKVAEKIKSNGLEIIKSVKLIDKTNNVDKIKDVYLTAIVAKKN